MTLESKRQYCVLLLLLAILAFSCSSQEARMGMAGDDGARLSYRVVGQGEVLVVIHDGPGGEKSIMYDGFDALGGGMKIVYYDQRGCGRSEPLAAGQSCTIEDNVRDLEALSSYLHLDGFSIAAHGWGAVIAVEYAREHPDRVDAIVLITPVSPHEPGFHLDGLMGRLSEDSQMHVRAVLDNPFASMLEKREQFVRAVLPLLFYDQGAMDRADLESFRYSPDVDSRLSAELKSFDLYARLDGVRIPTLVIAGRHDVLTPLSEQMAYVERIGTSRAVVFNESAHFPFLEENQAFLSHVKAFVHDGGIPPLAHADAGPD
jgi:proline iminopeptidase